MGKGNSARRCGTSPTRCAGLSSNFQGLFSEINLGSDKLGRKYADRNAKLCSIISEIARGMALFSTDTDTLGDAYEYLIGQFAAGSGKKAGEFYTPQQISSILSGIVTLDSQEPKTGMRKKLNAVFDFACGSGSLLLNVRHRMAEAGGTIGRIIGMESNITTFNLCRMNMLLHGVKDTEFEIHHGDTLKNDWDMLRETNPAKKPASDAVVANPPFSLRWVPGEEMAEDMRFKAHGVVLKSAADFGRPSRWATCSGRSFRTAFRSSSSTSSTSTSVTKSPSDVPSSSDTCSGVVRKASERIRCTAGRRGAGCSRAD